MTSDLPKSSTLSLKSVAFHFVGFSALALSALFIPSGPFVLVVSNPNDGAEGLMRVIGDAGGAYVSGGTLPWIAVAESEDRNFVSNLRRAGAVLVLNHRFAVGCRQGV